MMSLFSNKQPQAEVDLDRLEEEIRQEPTARAYAPPRARQPEPPLIPLQVIAQAITRLTWADAEAMGTAIQGLLAKEVSGTPQNLTAAIQSWASEVANEQL